MPTLDKLMIGLAIAVVLLFLVPMTARKPTNTQNVTAVRDPLDDIVGASPTLGNTIGVAIQTANVPWLAPPPLSLMMPISAVGIDSAASPGGDNCGYGGCDNG